MHIPSTMLHPALCALTTLVSALGITAICAKKQEKKPALQQFAGITALIFVLQMLNYPVQNGTSGHLIGAMLAVASLGTPFAILSIAIVLSVQAVFFADGGINALGANILNMSLIGAGLLGYCYSLMKEKKLNENISLLICSFASVVAAAIACSIELSLSGAVALVKVLPAMLSVHALIGIGESVLTLFVIRALRNIDEKNLSIASIALLAVLISPLASSFPDGLEWVAEELSFISFASFELPALFPDYQASFVQNAAISTIIAGISGLLITFASTMAIGKTLKVKKITIN